MANSKLPYSFEGEDGVSMRRAYKGLTLIRFFHNRENICRITLYKRNYDYKTTRLYQSSEVFGCW